jgi:hypothetical protein
MYIFIGPNSVSHYLKPNPKSFKLLFTVAVGGPALTHQVSFHFLLAMSWLQVISTFNREEFYLLDKVGSNFDN